MDRPKISAALEASLRRLEETTRRFNVFEAAGLATQEIRHSHFLSYMLNPLARHGLGTAFLDAFIAGAFDDPRASDGAAWQVQREWQCIDILLVDHNRKRVFVVENKVEAGEHGDQLARYIEVTERTYPEHERHYALLSPDAREPSHEAYRAVGYDVVARAFGQAAKSRALEPRVEAAIEDYLALLRRYVLPGSDEAAVCRSIWRAHDQELSALMTEQVVGEQAEYVAASFPVAWAMLAANRPDNQSKTLELAHSFQDQLTSSGTVVAGYTSKAYLAFGLALWTAEEKRLHQLGWATDQRYPLFFEFNIYNLGLVLNLWIADGVPAPLREAAFAWARTQPALFPQLPAQLRQRATPLVQLSILGGEDYETPAWADVESVARTRFEHFVSELMPRVVGASLTIDWPAPDEREAPSPSR